MNRGLVVLHRLADHSQIVLAIAVVLIVALELLSIRQGNRVKSLDEPSFFDIGKNIGTHFRFAHTKSPEGELRPHRRSSARLSPLHRTIHPPRSGVCRTADRQLHPDSIDISFTIFPVGDEVLATCGPAGCVLRPGVSCTPVRGQQSIPPVTRGLLTGRYNMAPGPCSLGCPFLGSRGCWVWHSACWFSRSPSSCSWPRLRCSGPSSADDYKYAR